MDILFDEAIEALEVVKILEAEKSKAAIDDMLQRIPFTTTGCGKVDWDNIQNYQSLNAIEELTGFGSIDESDKCFVIWDNFEKPTIKTNIYSVINAFDDITAVSFDTWIFLPEKNCVIESTFGSLKIGTSY